jgi:hypothetical protein
MAIDNLHARCEEGIRRIKEEAKRETEKIDRTQEKKKVEEAKTKKDKDMKDKKDLTPQQDEDDYIRKGSVLVFFIIFLGEKAIEKLKEIGAMMSDFQDIINQCREEERNKRRR